MRIYSFIFVLSLSFLLLACDQSAEQGGDWPVRRAIGFATSLPETRGELNFSSDDFGSMGVFAFYTQDDWSDDTAPAPNVMFNQLVEKMGTGWSYAPMKYWPENANDRLSFFAYAPYNAQGLTTSPADQPGCPQLFYTVPVKEKQQPDLLVADPQMNLTLQDGQVPFSMRHALTKVGIHVQNTSAFKVLRLSVSSLSSGCLTYTNNGFGWSLDAGSEQHFEALLDTELQAQSGNRKMATYYLLPIEEGDASVSLTYQYLSAKNTWEEVTLSKTLPTAEKSAWMAGSAISYTIMLAQDEWEGLKIELESMWTGTEKDIQLFNKTDLKPGDYYYNDGSCMDGGLRKIEDGVYTFESVLPGKGETTFYPPYPSSGKKCIGVLFYTGTGPGDDSPDIRAYVVALGETSVAFFAKKTQSDYPSGASTDISDYRGYQNTGRFLPDISNYPLAKSLKEYLPIDDSGNSSRWFIPSYAQMQCIWDSRSTYLNEALNRAGGTAFSEAAALWTSTEAGASTQYLLSNGEILATSKRTKAASRPILAF